MLCLAHIYSPNPPNVTFCGHVHMCVPLSEFIWGVHTCMCICMHMCAHSCEGQKSVWDVILHHTPPYFSRQDFSLNLELTHWLDCRLTSSRDLAQQPLGVQTKETVSSFSMRAGDPNSSPHTFIPGTLPAEPSLHVLLTF